MAVSKYNIFLIFILVFLFAENSVWGNSDPEYRLKLSDFSIRNPPLPWGEVSGTITTANHFDEWAKHGMDLGIHDLVDVTDGTLNINVYGYVNKGTLSSVLVRKSTNSSGEAAGAIDAWFLLVMASGLLTVARRFFLVKKLNIRRSLLLHVY